MHGPLRRLRVVMAAALLVPALAVAQSGAEGPVEVSANQAVFERDAGTGVYRGDAELIQGNRKLNADVLRLFTENEQLVRVEATGSPVRMREGKDLNAHADKLVYDLKRRRLILTGNAYVQHQGNTFEGARVEYDLNSRRMDASSEGDKRVRLVIPATNASQAQNGDDETSQSKQTGQDQGDDNTQSPTSETPASTPASPPSNTESP
ncbi:hypothetical protein A6D6_00436 [Alcanivorax xiamenensis]|uniref:Organic solvent tolerance-like N-terminal domain-containing protein n=1 Tax=Alcanivorax xiamenensis TaxID=1177156 RepID=A0ABQ6YCX0_9GAMM|nr:hypothetical protein A6D6_00436 [Alcanivorax xiamenensis]